MSLLHYYLGSMYAGKSTAAINSLLNATKYAVRIIISPSWQSRGYLSRNHYSHQISNDILILPSLNHLNIQALDKTKKTLILVDEVQFCSDDLLDPLLALCQKSKKFDLIIAGLQVGQHAQPFPNGPKLRKLFEQNTTILHAPCALCNQSDGLVAVRKWLINDHIRDEYSLMCKSCFDKFFAYGRGDELPIPSPLF